MTRLLTLLGDNPKIGLGGTAGAFTAGTVAEVADKVTMMVILDYLQAGAFLATIAVAIITIYAQHLKIKKEKKNGHN